MGSYPIILNLNSKKCLVVGGGEIALRKAMSLYEAGAVLTVVAPDIHPDFRSIIGINIVERAYQDNDLAGNVLVIAATDDRELNAHISSQAQAAGIPVNVVDDPELCSFIAPAVVKRGDLIIAVTTSGKSPSLSKKIRKELEELYGSEYTEYVNILGELRKEIKNRFATQKERELVFKRFLDDEIIELLRAGKREEALERAQKCIL